MWWCGVGKMGDILVAGLQLLGTLDPFKKKTDKSPRAKLNKKLKNNKLYKIIIKFCELKEDNPDKELWDPNSNNKDYKRCAASFVNKFFSIRKNYEWIANVTIYNKDLPMFNWGDKNVSWVHNDALFCDDTNINSLEKCTIAKKLVKIMKKLGKIAQEEDAAKLKVATENNFRKERANLKF